MRIVLDTSVLLPAFFGSGLCHALLERAFETGVELVLSEHILGEFEEWATAKFKAPKRDVADALRLMRSAAVIVTPAELNASVFDDADDLPVIGTAIAGQADALVTGDKGLVGLGSVAGIPIVTPRAMHDRLGGD